MVAGVKNGEKEAAKFLYLLSCDAAFQIEFQQDVWH
jgi:hypothetical protein